MLVLLFGLASWPNKCWKNGRGVRLAHQPVPDLLHSESGFAVNVLPFKDPSWIAQRLRAVRRPAATSPATLRFWSSQQR